MTEEIKKTPVATPKVHEGADQKIRPFRAVKVEMKAEEPAKADRMEFVHPRRERVSVLMNQLNDQISVRKFHPSNLVQVRDHRGEAPAKSHTGVMVIREGKMVTAPPKEAEAAAKVREAVLKAGKAGAKGEAPEAKKEGLTLLEKIFLAHFEEGAPLGEILAQGKFKFLPKPEKSWKEFFQRFLPFTLEKKANVSDLEAIIYRGLLQNTLISDLKFLSGKTDKFTRLQIQGSQILQKLASLMPGDVVAQALIAELAELIGGPEFAYLALSHKVVNPEMVDKGQSPIAEAYQSPEQMKQAAIKEGVREASQGIALDARTEQLIAERLDLDLKAVRGDTTIDASKKEAVPGGVGEKLGGLLFKKRRKGLFGGWETGGDAGPVFVPWYQLIFRPKKYKGKPRWWVPLIYFVTASSLALAAFYVFKFLLQR